jgi:TolA-binding protein
MLKIRRVAFALCVAFSSSLLVPLIALAQGGTGRETAAPSAKKATARKKPTRRRSSSSAEDDDNVSPAVSPPIARPQPTPEPGDEEYNQGLRSYFSSSYSDAIRYFKDAISINPNHKLAYNYLGNSYYSMSRYEEAATTYEQLIRLVGDEEVATGRQTGDVFFRLVYSHRKLGRNSAADDLERRYRSMCAVRKCSGVPIKSGE